MEIQRNVTTIVKPQLTAQSPPETAVIHLTGAGSDGQDCQRCSVRVSPERTTTPFERGCFVVVRGNVIVDARRSKSSTGLAAKWRAKMCVGTP